MPRHRNGSVCTRSITVAELLAATGLAVRGRLGVLAEVRRGDIVPEQCSANTVGTHCVSMDRALVIHCCSTANAMHRHLIRNAVFVA